MKQNLKDVWARKMFVEM